MDRFPIFLISKLCILQIKVLTGENFDSVAYDDNKHVLVEFYSPDCDICKKLAHLYEDIAENYKSKSDLIIAKVDAAQNEIDGIPIYEYPTFKFFPKGNVIFGCSR